MDYDRFLETVRVIRMLYGLPTAIEFFEKNINKFDKLIDISTMNLYNRNNKEH